MKTSKTMLAGLLALAAVGTASAQQKIYITGSTAFRSTTVNAISTVVGVSPTSWDGQSNGVVSANNANAVTWAGGSIGGTPVTIKASWSGSAAGIQTVAGSLNVRFLPDSAAAGSANPDPRNTNNTAEVITPDVAMSDAYQSSTPFNRTFRGTTYNSLTDTQVGVVTFKFVASNGFPGTNITDTQAQQLFSAGFAPVALFTGTATGTGIPTRTGDQLKVVYATGRDPDSGTRITAFADTFIGAQATVKQYQATISGNSVTSLQLYPATTINGVPVAQGNSGESSGGNLRTFMNKTLTASAYQTADPSATAGYLITYLGVSDANNVLPGGSGAGAAPAVELAFNGVPFSTNAIEQGYYSFWGYEHVMYRSTQTGIQMTFGDNLANTLLAQTTATLSPNISLNDMAVSRTGDGTPIFPNYL